MAKNDKKSDKIDGKSKEIEEQEAERKKKKAELEKKIKVNEKNQKKRINKLVNFPFKTLLQISLICGLIYFIILFFGQDVDIMKSVYSAAIVFLAVLLGIGIIMTAFILIISQRKEIEAKQKELEEIEMQRLEDERRQQEIKSMEEEIKINERQLKNNIGTDISDNNFVVQEEPKPIELPNSQIDKDEDLVPDLNENDFDDLNNNN